MSRRGRRDPAPPSAPGGAPARDLLALAGLVAAVYLRSLQGSFLWDDEVVVQGNALIRSLSDLPAMFTTGFFAGAGSYYRPLAILSYALDHALYGLEPWGYHLTNLLLHAGAALLLHRLLLRFGPRAAFWAAALWAVHPVHVHTVAPVYSRNCLMEALVLGALLAFEAAPRKAWAGWLCVGLYLAGLLSKESAIGFPLAAAAWRLLLSGPEERRGSRWTLAGLGAVAVLYLAARAQWMPFVQSRTLSMVADASLPVRAWTFLGALARYAGLLAFPHPLRTERHFVDDSLADPMPWLGLLLSAGALAAAWRLRERDPAPLFGLLWFFLALGPTSNLLPLAITMSEHWLYVPSMGLAWCLAWALARGFQGPRAALLPWALGLALAAFAARSYVRVLDWKDGPTLYAKDLPLSSNSFLLRNNLGVELFRRGDLEGAAEQFEAAVALRPSYGMSINNLGAVRERQGRREEAARAYLAAVRFSGDALAYTNLARLLLKAGKLKEGREVLEAGLAAHPYDDGLRELQETARGLRPPAPKR